MNSIADDAQRIVISWAVLSPFWLLTVAALVWGRTVLAKDEILKGLVWTLAASVVAFPVMWTMLGYFAGFNPQPRSSAMAVGGNFAGLLFPIYSALIACVAFGFRIEAARKRGAPARPLAVRVITGLVLAAVVILGLLAIGVGALFSAGPKVFGT